MKELSERLSGALVPAGFNPGQLLPAPSHLPAPGLLRQMGRAGGAPPRGMEPNNPSGRDGRKCVKFRI